MKAKGYYTLLSGGRFLDLYGYIRLSTVFQLPRSSVIFALRLYYYQRLRFVQVAVNVVLQESPVNKKDSAERCGMQEINPITNKINDLLGRSDSLRGYL